MTVTTITFEVDSDRLSGYTDEYLAQLWHLGQANPAPFGDAAACNFAELVGREIVRRWLGSMAPELWTHQASHVKAKLSTDRRQLLPEAEKIGGED